jgi:hypothetical protein
MDEIQWNEVRNGDLESLGAVLFSGSTSHRIRALQEIREKNGNCSPFIKMTILILVSQGLFCSNRPSGLF